LSDGRGIFFDLDGTLVDNEHLKAIAFSEAIKQLGGQSQPSVYGEVMGMSGPVIRSHFLKRAGIEADPDEYFRLFRLIYERLLETDLVVRPGAVKLLAYLAARQFRLAIVSSAYRASVDYIITRLGLSSYFDLVLTGDDFREKKPDPECYVLALQKTGLSRRGVIVFEDTEAGLTAAGRAGLRAVGIRHAYNHSHDFGLATRVYESFDKELDAMKSDINAMCGVGPVA
jgi:HAD superfamily hydrolase (TIGR01509 family)